jgi:hypothetical protein
MNYPIRIEGCEGQNIEVQLSTMFAGPKLFVNGQPASKGPGRSQMILRRNDGNEIIATWKPMFLGLDVPQLSVNGIIIEVVEPLKWYEWVWSGIPILLIFSGGLIGGVIGFFSFTLSTKIFRSSFSTIGKYLVSAAISIAAVVIFFGIAAVIFGAINE